MDFAQFFDQPSGRWCRHVRGGYGDTWFLHASYDESREQWIVVCTNEAGASVGEWEYSGRLTLDEALDEAQRRWTPELSPRSVYSIGGEWIGLIVEVDLPRFCVETETERMWLRVDAIFCHTPSAMFLVCDQDDLDIYRTEVDRRSARGRTMVCGWCNETLQPGSGPPLYGLCAACDEREDLGNFPYGDLINRSRR